MPKRKIILFVLVSIALVVVLSFAYYTISPFFIKIKINEMAPDQMPASETASEITTGNETKRVPIVDTLAHPASGYVRIVEAGRKKFVRYEDYKTINGPDIFVYLSKDKEAKNFVSLGPVKATEGNINYEIPQDVNVNDYQYVLTWCRAFGVLFNSADISSIR